MPRGDGTGPAGGGRGGGMGGSGAGRGGGMGGSGAGRGRMGGARPGAGPTGSCVCPACGATSPHQRGLPCNSLKCPKCGSPMTRQ